MGMLLDEAGREIAFSIPESSRMAERTSAGCRRSKSAAYCPRRSGAVRGRRREWCGWSLGDRRNAGWDLWQNTNGQAAIWLMNGTPPTFKGLVGTNPGLQLAYPRRRLTAGASGGRVGWWRAGFRGGRPHPHPDPSVKTLPNDSGRRSGCLKRGFWLVT
jgi:hypothetical protein